MVSDHETDIGLIIEAARTVLKYRSFARACRKIFEICKQKTGATAGYVALLSEDGTKNEVIFLDSGGLPCSVDPSLPMPIRGLRGNAYQLGKPVYDNHFEDSEWMKFIPEGHTALTNVMFAPLVLDEKAIGLIGLANKPHGFTPEDTEWTAIFAEIAAIALYDSFLMESLRKSEKKYRDAFNRAKLFQGLLAHDMNNILQAIISSVEVSKRVIEQKEHPDLFEMLKLIERQFERGKVLIKRVQKLSLLEEQASLLKKMEIGEILRTAIKNVKESFKSRKVEIQTYFTQKYYSSTNTILLDVFENILQNAVMYNKQEVVEVSIHITPIADNNTKYLKIEFSDNGIGLSDDRKKLIFQSIQNSGGSKTGMGIGLSLVKKALEIFKGKIWVEDRIKGDHTKGAKFVILLPDVS
ncbi:MAG: sensor histidine kinase [Candidatus Helarchaeota archaeon]